MSSSLHSFSNNTAADIAILSRVIPQDLLNDRLLPNWNMNVSALTTYHENIDYLRTLSNKYTFDTISQQDVIFRDSELPVEFKVLIPNNYSDIVFVIIDNISEQQNEITSITLRSILLSLLGAIILGAGLFILISKPLSRLASVSQALPLLAKQEYGEVRNILGKNSTTNRIDELDQLEYSTKDLTIQLEELHNSIKERSQTVLQRSLELQHERDFIKSLIDTAQLIIITLDQYCNITSFNDFAERTTGYLEQNIINTSFQQFFPSEKWPENEATLIQLKEGQQTISQQESEFIHSDGSIHIISWLHSSLNNPTDSSVVLSVGLDITDKKQSEEQIAWLADHDVLTELYNRRRFNIEFERILNQSIRSKHHGSLLFLDLDQFKDINDSFGHLAGDHVLQKVALTLKSIARTTDVIARLGGDEFAIILSETDAAGTVIMAKKITETLASLSFQFDNNQHKITTSVGIVNFPITGASIEELISNADLAMYQAKYNGKNTWHQFKTDDQTRLQLEARVHWKQKIEEALENELFTFHYQPIMDISQRTVNYYEMLIRMKGENDEIYRPKSFISIAEQTGLIHDIDRLALKYGIRKQAELEQSGTAIHLSLNLSAYAIDDSALPDLIQQTLHEYKANPEYLTFELTETAAVADLAQAKTLMNSLNKLGISFSLDDFGSGFSSFQYMRELPINIVKIDGSFISDLINSPDDQLFVKALVDVAKGMGKKTVAEFVENEETLELLGEIGIDYAQGYYIGKPRAHLL